MKTRQLLIAIITIASMLLTGCGGQPAATTAVKPTQAEVIQPTAAVPAAAPTSTQAQAVVPPAGASTKVVYSFPADSVQVVMRPEQYEIFKKLNTGVEVELLSVPEDGYDEKNIAMIAAGEKLDVFGSGDVFVAPFIHDGISYDLTNLIATDPEFNVNDFYPEILDFFKDKAGHVNMLPGAYDVQRIYYNKKLFDDAKLAYPTDDWTWNDFKMMSAKLTQGEGIDKTYGFMADTAWYVWMPYVWANGGNLWSEDGTRCTLSEPAAVEALDWYADFMRKGNSPSPSELSGLGMSGGDMFTTGKVAMVSSGGWDSPYFSEIKDFEWGQVPLPKGPNGRATTLHLAMNLISSKSKNPELAWKWLRFLASPEMYTYEAVKYGQGVPPRRSATEKILANPPADANPQAMRNIQIGLTSVAFGRTLPKILNISEVLDNVVSPNLDLFWNGDVKTAKEVTAKICSEMKLTPMDK
jgi:multiple sugar transport system substrate-binding protein